MRTSLFKLVAAFGAALSLQTATAQVLFSDDFELGMGNWTTPVSPATPLDWSTDQNAVPGGGLSSALVNSSGDKMYHNLGSEVSGGFFLTFYVFDDTATRSVGEARSYGGAGYADGSLQQLFAVGKYNSVTAPGEVFSPTNYQARVLTGTGAGWINLNAAGAPLRSPGWHKFDIERLADETTVNFYVDGILGRTFAGATAFTVDSLGIGSVAAGTTTGNSYIDGVSLTVPEPSALALFALGGGLLLWRLTRRVD